ncbi:MAG TPA: type VI secretion system baseplate subunit TssK [Gemmatimonadaceae bacterium]|nr:type VI secretion system baseplate subunit TssK [Gemmatimonadaceae bacterium]
MRQLQPVLWTKGVLLSPQHLQTQDRFLEDQLEFQLAALEFCPWGFHQLTIDREALAGGSFGLTAASGLFSDGLLFDMPGADPLPPPKLLEGAFGPDQEAVHVYLAIPEHHYGGHNVSATEAAAATRYRAEELLRRDETTGLGERPIQVGRKNFRILLEGEALEGHSVLRVARVTKSVTGDYQLDPRFIPPLVNIEASDYVMAIARRLVEIMSAKSSSLAGTRRQRNQSLAEFGIADVASFWLLYTINSYFPMIRHLYETRRGHPSQLYTTMLTLAGALTTFSTTFHPRDLPAYEHEGLSGCFTRLDEQVRELLETVVPASTVSIPMRLVQPSVYAAALDQDRFLAAPQIFLAIAVEGKAPDIAHRAPQLLKVSAASQLDHLIRQALPGISLTHVPTPPGTVAVKLDHHYFLLNKSGSEWDAVQRARNIAAYVPAEFPNPQLELVIMLPPR